MNLFKIIKFGCLTTTLPALIPTGTGLLTETNFELEPNFVIEMKSNYRIVMKIVNLQFVMNGTKND